MTITFCFTFEKKQNIMVVFRLVFKCAYLKNCLNFFWKVDRKWHLQPSVLSLTGKMKMEENTSIQLRISSESY